MIGRIFILSFLPLFNINNLHIKIFPHFYIFFVTFSALRKKTIISIFQHTGHTLSLIIIKQPFILYFSWIFFFLKMNRRWVVSTRFFFLSHLNENCRVGIFGACPAVYSTLSNASHKTLYLFVNMFEDFLASNTCLREQILSWVSSINQKIEWVCQQGLSIKTVKKLTMLEFDFYSI